MRTPITRNVPHPMMNLISENLFLPEFQCPLRTFSYGHPDGTLLVDNGLPPLCEKAPSSISIRSGVHPAQY